MYRYSPKDQKMIEQRVEQFRDQVQRNLAGKLGEDEFLPLRLQNGLYYQLHAPMLRIAIPYGMLSSDQLRRLGDCAKRYSKGYGHFTTRTNMQYHWPQLEDVPDVLAELAEKQIHSIQTSGNCIRNTTVDQFAGVAADELEDPRPYCEIIRQWSTFHPEFAYLPRKFKIAVSGASEDRAAVKWHDIGLYLVQNESGEVGFSIWVGGGMGRTPLVAQQMYEFVPKHELLSRLESIIRVYNLQGNRDNKFKARIKILVKALGMEKLRELVDADWEATDKTELELTDARIEEMKTYFTTPDYDPKAVEFAGLDAQKSENTEFSRWVINNGTRHKVKGYRAMTISLAHADRAAGDVTTEEMHALADLADQYSFGEIRVTHDQNIVFSDVRIEDLLPLWQKLTELDLARSNIGYLTDLICCPGLTYCGLADAHSIPVAQSINDYFDDIDYVHDIGHLEIKMSGCMNACGHHHAGHIGIMGRERKGQEFYAIQIGGSRDLNADTGKIVGKPVKADEVAPTVKTILDEYLTLREGEESFIETYQRVGIDPFKAALKV